MQYQHLDSKGEEFLTGCLLNAALFFLFFPPSLKICALFLVFLSVLEVSDLNRWPPIANQDHALALGSRDLGRKGTKAKSRRGVFPRLGWKVGLGSHRDTGRGRRGRDGWGGEIYFCSLALGPVRRPMYQKDHRVRDEPVGRFMAEFSTWETWVMLGRFGEMANVKNALQMNLCP